MVSDKPVSGSLTATTSVRQICLGGFRSDFGIIQSDMGLRQLRPISVRITSVLSNGIALLFWMVLVGVSFSIGQNNYKAAMVVTKVMSEMRTVRHR